MSKTIRSHIKPMLARPGPLPADQDGWSFEVKWDGVRAIAYAGPDGVCLTSRSLRDITASYPELAGLGEALQGRVAILDGEIVAFGEDGRPSFERLQRRMHLRGGDAGQPDDQGRTVRGDSGVSALLFAETPVVYAIFDVLELDGESLMEFAYEQRRKHLEDLGLDAPAWRVPANHTGPDAGERLLAATRDGGLEGIVAKRLASRYEPGARNGNWVKLKHRRRQELMIGGWVPGEGRRRERIGALLMGSLADGELRFAGRVGTGFNELTLTRLTELLASRTEDESPFAGEPRLPPGAVFVRPELVAEIEFVEWTSDGMMRAPSFKGLRDDRSATTVVRAREPATPAGSPSTDDPLKILAELPEGGRVVEVDGRELTLSNWDKVLFPDDGFTKGDLIEYYARVAPAVLPHLRDRALTLKRYPNGVKAPHFYEKRSPSHRPDWVATATVGGVPYTLVQERATLVWLANLADVELHTSLALADAPQRPTLLVFDLDPGEGAGIVDCCEVGVVLRGMFDALGLVSCAKTSGSKGLQVYVPLGDESASYRDTKPLARRIAELLEGRMPEIVVSRMTRRLRAGRVLVDWSQNTAHKTTVTAYSVRALANPGVSTPLSWQEVEACRRRADGSLLRFTPADVLRRVREFGDLFAQAASVRQALPVL
jgi:bifunctional non-homologous end joining protein LigD